MGIIRRGSVGDYQKGEWWGLLEGGVVGTIRRGSGGDY